MSTDRTKSLWKRMIYSWGGWHMCPLFCERHNETTWTEEECCRIDLNNKASQLLTTYLLLLVLPLLALSTLVNSRKIHGHIINKIWITGIRNIFIIILNKKSKVSSLSKCFRFIEGFQHVKRFNSFFLHYISMIVFTNK